MRGEEAIPEDAMVVGSTHGSRASRLRDGSDRMTYAALVLGQPSDEVVANAFERWTVG